MATLAVSIGVAVLLELVDPVVVSARQLEAIVELPLLGSLPRIPQPASPHPIRLASRPDPSGVVARDPPHSRITVGRPGVPIVRTGGESSLGLRVRSFEGMLSRSPA